MDITSTTLQALPRFEIIACMSLLHHVVYRHGMSEAKALLREIARKTIKCMFDMGGPGEEANKWASALSMFAIWLWLGAHEPSKQTFMFQKVTQAVLY